MPRSGRDERAWVRGAQAGSASDLEALFRTHWAPAYRAAYLVVHDAAAAEDIAQEAFLAAVRALDRFDRRRPFGPWLHRIVVNRAIDWARARALRAEVAFVEISGEQCQFPQILGAYESVYRWAKEHGREPGASPREIYLTAPGPGERLEIALPLR